MIKLVLTLASIAGAGFFAVDRVPALKANIVEYVNPRVKEARIINELSESLEILESRVLPEKVDIVDGRSTRELIAEAEELVATMSKLNDSNSGIVKQITSRVFDAFKSSSESDPTPTPCAQ